MVHHLTEQTQTLGSPSDSPLLLKPELLTLHSVLAVCRFPCNREGAAYTFSSASSAFSMALDHPLATLASPTPIAWRGFT